MSTKQILTINNKQKENLIEEKKEKQIAKEKDIIVEEQTYGNEFQAYTFESDEECCVELSDQNPSFKYKFIY